MKLIELLKMSKHTLILEQTEVMLVMYYMKKKIQNRATEKINKK